LDGTQRVWGYVGGRGGGAHYVSLGYVVKIFSEDGTQNVRLENGD